MSEIGGGGGRGQKIWGTFSNERAQNRGVRSHFVYQTAVPSQMRDFCNVKKHTLKPRVHDKRLYGTGTSHCLLLITPSEICLRMN